MAWRQSFVSGLALLASLALPNPEPAFAQQTQAPASSAETIAQIRGDIAAFVKPTNAARLNVAKQQLTAAGLPFTVETFAGGEPGRPAEGSNLVAAIGEGPREILLVAHYDAIPLQDGQLAHGLVDNAASVVAMIAALKDLRGEPLRHRVRLLLTDQEELGTIGAERWIAAHGLSNLAAVVNSDVAAYGDTLMYGENNGPQSAPLLRAIRELCAARAMSCVGYRNYPPSDDRPFVAAGAPTISLGFQDEKGAHQMWLAFNGGRGDFKPEFIPRVFRLIHTPEDRIEAVDPATVQMAAVVYAEFVRRLDRELP